MTDTTRRVGRSTVWWDVRLFWLWVGANAAAYLVIVFGGAWLVALTSGVGGGVVSTSRTLTVALVAVGASLFYGVVLGRLQWQVLRQRMPMLSFKRWFVATVIPAFSPSRLSSVRMRSTRWSAVVTRSMSSRMRSSRHSCSVLSSEQVRPRPCRGTRRGGNGGSSATSRRGSSVQQRSNWPSGCSVVLPAIPETLFPWRFRRHFRSWPSPCMDSGCCG